MSDTTTPAAEGAVTTVETTTTSSEGFVTTVVDQVEADTVSTIEAAIHRMETTIANLPHILVADIKAAWDAVRAHL